MTEIYALSSVSQKELTKTLDLFEEQREEFFIMIPVMGRVLTWRRSKTNASLENIKLSNIVRFSSGKVSPMPLPAGIASVDELIHVHCKLDIAASESKEAAEAEFSLAKNYRSFVRAKFVLWFVVEFCKSIHAESSKIFSGLKSVPKALLDLSSANAVAILGPRLTPPRGLIDFIKSNYEAYVSWHEVRYPLVIK